MSFETSVTRLIDITLLLYDDEYSLKIDRFAKINIIQLITLLFHGSVI